MVRFRLLERTASPGGRPLTYRASRPAAPAELRVRSCVPLLSRATQRATRRIDGCDKVIKGVDTNHHSARLRRTEFDPQCGVADVAMRPVTDGIQGPITRGESSDLMLGAADESALAEICSDAAAETAVCLVLLTGGSSPSLALLLLVAASWRACMLAQTLAVAVPSEVLLLHSEIGLRISSWNKGTLEMCANECACEYADCRGGHCGSLARAVPCSTWT